VIEHPGDELEHVPAGDGAFRVGGPGRDAGETFVIAAGGEENLLHINRLDERTLASPALVDGTWYIRTAEHLYAIGEGTDASP
jgi:hypothetical protein